MDTCTLCSQMATVSHSGTSIHTARLELAGHGMNANVDNWQQKHKEVKSKAAVNFENEISNQIQGYQKKTFIYLFIYVTIGTNGTNILKILQFVKFKFYVSHLYFCKINYY